MPVVSVRIVHIEPYAGRVRVRYGVIFTGGRDEPYGPVKLADEAAAIAFFPEIGNRVLFQISGSDAREAARNGMSPNAAHGEASQPQVEAQYLLNGVRANDTDEAFRFLSPIQTRLESGMPDNELANLLNVREGDVIKVRKRWTNLEPNSAVITSFNAIDMDA